MTVRKRAKALIIFFFVFYLAIVGRAFYYQVIGDHGIEQYRETQYEGAIVIPPARGEILDRNGSSLAVTLSTFSIGASPRRIKDKLAVAAIASRLLGVKRKLVLAHLRLNRSFVYIKRQVNRDLARKFIDKVGSLPEFKSDYRKFGRIAEFSLIPEPKRYYPGKELASHTLGFCDIDSKGLEGVEKTFDKYLRGKKITLQVEKDAKGRLILPEKLPEQEMYGNTLQLTLDRNIQFIAEKEVAEGVRKYHAKGGMAIVMSPITGEIYAMALYPSFDSNRPSLFRPWRRKDRIITDVYEPGSTFKVFLLAGALDSKKVSLREKFYCEKGFYRVRGRTIHDTHPREWLRVPEVIKYSSNIGAVKIAERLTPDRFYDYLEKFGFGAKTGIELAGESPGIMPAREVFRKPIRYSTAAFGQGVAVTPIQIISGFSSVINGGIGVKPYLIKEVRDRSGKILFRGKSTYRRRVITRETSALMRRILTSVVTEEGTGTLAKVKGYTVGGKTGTSQKVDMDKGGYSDKRIASFIGFFPADRPLMTVLVLIDEPQDEVYGGLVAAPIFSRIVSKVAIYGGIPPDEGLKGVEVASTKKKKKHVTLGERLPVMKVSLSKSGAGEYIMPDLDGLTMAQVIEMIEYLPLSYSFKGSGVVLRQYPPAGGRIRPGITCRLFMGEN